MAAALHHALLRADMSEDIAERLTAGCLNLCLAAEAVGAGAVPIAAFDDEQLNAALGLDGVDRFAVYAAALGKKPD